MCDTSRRCDKPSCPCNEPDTDIKDALTRMQERWPGAECGLDTSAVDDATWCACVSLPGDIEWLCYGPTPHAAVDAAIKEHEDMVKADALFKVLKAECEAWRAQDAAYAEWMRREDLVYNSRPDMFAYRVEACQEHGDTLKAARAARAATDKAGALR